MPFDIRFENMPAGYVTKAARKDEQVDIIEREFTSSEDGETFISRLEGMPSDILNMLPSTDLKMAHRVAYMLVVIRRDGTATVYLNQELKIILKAKFKMAVEAGQPAYDDDFIDIEELTFEGIEIPDDCGLLLVYSKGWRKSLFYDLSPLHAGPRTYNLGRALGHYASYLWFQHIFKITESQWNIMVEQHWFPFISLKHDTIKSMISMADAGFNIDDLIDRIETEVTFNLREKLKTWATRKTFEPHMPLFATAVERHLHKDYHSSTSILWPRIEGIMRSYFTTVNPSSPKVNKMIDSVTTPDIPHNTSSLILPDKFKRYLTDVVFNNFEPNDPKDLNRNTVSHGVAPADLFSIKYSLIGFLIVDQLFYLMQPPSRA